MSKYKTKNKNINFAENIGKKWCIPQRIYPYPSAETFSKKTSETVVKVSA